MGLCYVVMEARRRNFQWLVTQYRYKKSWDFKLISCNVKLKKKLYLRLIYFDFLLRVQFLKLRNMQMYAP